MVKEKGLLKVDMLLNANQPKKVFVWSLVFIGYLRDDAIRLIHDTQLYDSYGCIQQDLRMRRRDTET